MYDARIIEQRVASLSGFDTVRFAMKANSNLAVLGVVKRSGALVEAVSAGEIARAIAAGFAPREVSFTADLFDRAALEWIGRNDVPVNLGSPSMIEQYGKRFPGPRDHVAHQPGVRARARAEGQHGRRNEQARHLARSRLRSAARTRAPIRSARDRVCTCTSDRAATSSI